jgi:hypothetical protein
VINYAHGPELAVMALDWGDRVHMGVVERLIKDQAKEADRWRGQKYRWQTV